VEKVILVDKLDNPIGEMEKQEAHVKGLLHRAFSIFIFNDKEEILLHQRAHHKYHSGGLWTNTCCSHPRPGEHIHDAANRRLVEEMGMVCTLKEQFSFIYKAKLDNDLFEHELDHVFFGKSSEKPVLNKDEVADYKYLSIKSIQQDLIDNPGRYTAWFKICFDEVVQNYRLEY
tara:strand:+ start:145 stop:663 length:519 start_codon:yes stop_codon:yes gene_type:complete